MRHFWTANAIALGVWEAVAKSTGRIPTVTTSVRAAVRRHPRTARVGVILWLAGLGQHLLGGEK